MLLSPAESIETLNLCSDCCCIWYFSCQACFSSSNFLEDNFPSLNWSSCKEPFKLSMPRKILSPRSGNSDGSSLEWALETCLFFHGLASPSSCWEEDECWLSRMGGVGGRGRDLRHWEADAVNGGWWTEGLGDDIWGNAVQGISSLHDWLWWIEKQHC